MNNPAHPMIGDGFLVTPGPLRPEEQQRRASDPHASVWVSASAGSGKTRVLTHRVLRLLLDGVLPSRILCLTFTNAAAAEMSIRLTAQLTQWAVCDEDALRDSLDSMQGCPPMPEQLDEARRLLAKVLACPGGMRINTIHGFAQEILRRFPLEAGVMPHFTVLEPSDAEALRAEAFDALLRDAIAAPEDAVGRALSALSVTAHETRLHAMIHDAADDAARLRQAIAGAGSLDRLVQAQRALLDLGPEDTETGALSAACWPDPVAERDLRRVAAALMDGTKTDQDRGRAILDWLDAPHARRMDDLEAYQGAFLTQKGAIQARLATKKIVEAVPDCKEVLTREAERLLALDQRLSVIRVAERSAAVTRLASAFAERYAERKALCGGLDFDDLIHATHALLRRPDIAPWVLFKLDGGLDHILVDEAQDTSPIQWRIIAALADEFFTGKSARDGVNRTLFVVGDEKQSIFSFQGADPAAFEAMRQHFAARILAVQPDRYRSVPLNVSFRSAPAILKAVDTIFATPDAQAGVSRMPVHHEAFRRDHSGRVELWPLILKSDTDSESESADGVWSLPDTMEVERDPVTELAEHVATRIRQWLDDGAMIHDRELKARRPMHAGDIMVLVRRRSAFVPRLVRQLKRRGVPVTGVDRMVLAQQLPVMDLLALMQCALLPDDDLTLATVLRGPLLGASDDQLMTLAVGRRGSLWQSLTEAARADEALAVMRDWLAACFAEADRTTPFAFLSRALTLPCPGDPVSGRRALLARLGPDAADPIDELLNEAEAFGARHAPSLQTFLHAMTTSEAEVKRAMDTEVGRVRITTVHASKGLEAPVVILPDTTGVPSAQHVPHWLWHPPATSFDPGGPLYPPHAVPFHITGDSTHPVLSALRSAARQRQIEEHNRLFYVALTRAADRLVICGYEPGKTDKSAPSWYDMARAALEPLHNPFAPDERGAIQPAILIADPVLPVASEVSEQRQPAAASSVTALPLPLWAAKPPAPEPTPPRPLTPSRPDDAEPPAASPRDLSMARGTLAHRLLQSLPDLASPLRAEAARRYLSGKALGLDAGEADRLVQDVLAVLEHPDFAPLFGPGSLAEVPITGLVGKRVVSGQIDRLCLRENEVWIVDFKTNRLPPASPREVPMLYRRQMKAYRDVLTAIYPGHAVRCFLLWTATLRMMPVDPILG